MENERKIWGKSEYITIMMFRYIEPNRRFQFEVPAVCNFFYSRSQIAEYEGFFKDFSWSLVAGFHWSNELITTLEELEDNFLSHDFCLKRSDVPYWVKESADFENIKNFFIDEELILLEFLAEDFLEEFGVKEE